VYEYHFDGAVEEFLQKGKTIIGNDDNSTSTSVSISGDGNRLAAGSLGKGSIYQYSADDQIWYNIHDETKSDVECPEPYGSAVAFSKDGKRVAISNPKGGGDCQSFISVLSDPNVVEIDGCL